VAIRHGGDEFALLLTHEHLTADAAGQRAKELRAAIADIPWDAVAPGLVVTVTVGVAISAASYGGAPPSTEPVEIYRAADRALYAAKRDGSGIVLAEVVATV
jgi:diguanylate cyclase